MEELVEGAEPAGIARSTVTERRTCHPRLRSRPHRPLSFRHIQPKFRLCTGARGGPVGKAERAAVVARSGMGAVVAALVRLAVRAAAAVLTAGEAVRDP